MQLGTHTYAVNWDGWSYMNEKIGTSRITLNGYVDRAESGNFSRIYELVCQIKASNSEGDGTLESPTVGSLATLRAEYLKVDAAAGTNKIYFVDPEGVVYDPATGVDEANHYHDCGVYFEAMGSPQNLSPVITGAEATFYVPIMLRVARADFNA
jgi:hypothetical protein